MLCLILGFFLPCFSLTASLECTAYHRDNQRDTTLCRQAVEESLAQCRLSASSHPSVPAYYRNISVVIILPHFFERVEIANFYRTSVRRGVVACRPFASLADWDDSTFCAQFANMSGAYICKVLLILVPIYA